MSSRLKASALVLSLLLLTPPLLVLTPPPRAQADTAVSDIVLIREDDVVDDDLYASGNKVNIQGRVEGDLVAAAFEEVRVDGVVTGDVLAATAIVIVNGEVGGSIRAAASRVEVGGKVGEDVVAAAVDLVVGGEVGGDVIVTAWSAQHRGAIRGDLMGNFGRTTLGGSVEGDVQVSTRSLRVSNGAQVGGDLIYRSAAEFDTGSAVVDGTVVHQRPLPPNVRVRGLGYLLLALAVIGTALLGMAVCWAFPRSAGGAAGAFRRRPGRVVLAGVAAVSTPLVVIGLLGWFVVSSNPTTAVPLFLSTLPVVLVVAALSLVGALLALVPAATGLGGMLARKGGLHARFLIGLVALGGLLLVPVAGIWLLLAAVVVGAGSWFNQGVVVSEPVTGG